MWIYKRCTDIVLDANERFFQYDLDYIEDLQFTMYDETDTFYDKHIDTGNVGHTARRKLTFSIQLSDPEHYDGGDLLLYIGSTPTEVRKEQGFINLFPSYTLHEVTPITRGKRYSLVGWVHGPKFR